MLIRGVSNSGVKQAKNNTDHKIFNIPNNASQIHALSNTHYFVILTP